MRKLVFHFALILSPVFSQAQNEKEFALSDKVLNHMIASEYDSLTPMMDSVMIRKMAPGIIERVWEGFQNQFGNYVATEDRSAERVKEKNIVTVRTRLKFDKINIMLTTSFNDSMELSGLFVRPAQPGFTYNFPQFASGLSYSEKKVTVKTNEFEMPGIVTYPSTGKKMPLVVLVQGSGPHDMDETIGPNKPFQDLAYGLAKMGVATLRYEKRTNKYANDLNPKTITPKEEVVDDALSAINLAASLEMADPKNIYLLGHSLGGMLAPQIAFESKKLKGVIIMAGITSKLEDLIAYQFEYLLSQGGSLSKEEQEMIDKAKSDAIEVKKITKVKSDDERVYQNIPAAYWAYLNNYDPAAVAKKLKIPVLVVQGERDYQVPVAEFEKWKKGMLGKANTSFKSFEKLNHLFLEGEGKSLPKEYENSGNIPFYVMEELGNWINK